MVETDKENLAIPQCVLSMMPCKSNILSVKATREYHSFKLQKCSFLAILYNGIIDNFLQSCSTTVSSVSSVSNGGGVKSTKTIEEFDQQGSERDCLNWVLRT